MSRAPADQVAPDPTRDALAAIWDTYRDAIRERVRVLERAVGELTRGTLSEDARGEAERSAHNLAGALGTFGFGKGSERAREIELILARADTLGPSRLSVLSELVAALRSELDDTPPAGPPTTAGQLGDTPDSGATK